MYYFFCSYLIQKKLNGAFAKQIKNLILIGSQTKHAGGIQIVSMHTDNDSINIIGVNVFETGWGVHIKCVLLIQMDS